MCHNDLEHFENWITRLIFYTSIPIVLALESSYCGSYTEMKEYFLHFMRF